MLVEITVLIITLLVAAYLYVRHCYSYWKRKGLAELSPSFPFGDFRAAFLQQKSVAENVRHIYNSSDAPVVGAYMGLKPIVIPRDPRIIQHMLVKESLSFSHRGINVNEDVDKMVHMIFLQNGEKWRESRRLLSPAFTSGRLKDMFDTIVKCGDSLQNHIGQYATSGESIEIGDVMARFTTNVVASVSFGLHIDSIKDPNCDFRKNGARFFESNLRNGLRNIFATMSPTLTRLFRLRFVDKQVQEFMTDIVRQNIEYREKNNIICKDVFQLLIQVRNAGEVQGEGDWNLVKERRENVFSFEEIAAQSFEFYVGGYESSSTSMTFCLYEMARNPAIQQKAYDEIISVLKQHDNKLTYDALSEMKYLEKCLTETLRLHAPFGVYTRRCVKDYKIPDTDVVVEKGTTLLLPISGLQRDAKYYKDPEEFIPERYDENSTINRSFTEMPFLTFGDGPRICIGLRLAKLQAKIGVCLMVKNFHFELSEEHLNETMTFKASTIIKTPANGINLKVKQR